MQNYCTNKNEPWHGHLITPSQTTRCLSASQDCTYLLCPWRHQRAIIQTNYEINNLGVAVCVSRGPFTAPDWTRCCSCPCGVCLMALLKLFSASCACASAVSQTVTVTRGPASDTHYWSPTHTHTHRRRHLESFLVVLRLALILKE